MIEENSRKRTTRLAVMFLAATIFVAICYSVSSSSSSSEQGTTTTSSTTTDNNNNRNHNNKGDCLFSTTSVLIVGGGVSGLAAARELLQQQRRRKCNMNITLLEAKDRFGGRLHTVQMKMNKDHHGSSSSPSHDVVDLGGAYWHGASPAVQQLLTDFPPSSSFQTVVSGGSSMHPGKANARWMHYSPNKNNNDSNTNTNCNDGSWVVMGKEEVEQVQKLFVHWKQTMQEYYREYRKEMARQNSSSSAAAAAAATADDKEEESNSNRLLRTWSQTILDSLASRTEQERLKFQLHMSFELDDGVPLEDLALDGIENDWDWKEYDGDDSITVGGMQTLVDALVHDLRRHGGGGANVNLLTNHRVRQIAYSQDHECHVKTTSGQEFSADACIITLPLGVLKERAADMFVPKLPVQKELALDRAGTSAFNTLAVQWGQPVCQNASAFYLVGHPNQENPLRFGFVCSGMLRGQNPFLTQFYISGRDHPFDNMSYWEEQAVQIVTDIHPSMDLLTIEDLVISRWHMDDDILGSYSVPTRHTKGNIDRQILAEPVDGVLFFAGEHTNTNGRYQSIDGAFDTGVRAARQVSPKKRLQTSSFLSNTCQLEPCTEWQESSASVT